MTTSQREFLIGKLRLLCEEEGGPYNVGAQAGVSGDNLRQVLQGAKLRTSGEPRSLGRVVVDKLSRRYPRWLDSQHTPEGIQRPRGAEAHILSHHQESDSPQYNWEALVKLQSLPLTFRVVMPDDSMAPRVKKGDVLEFSSSETPRTGDGVLVRDGAGRLYFRIYRVGRPEQWEAHPVNTDFLPLHSERDNLSVAGVLIGVPKHRWA